VEFGDRDEMTVDSALGVKRESSEKGFPYLLGTQLLNRPVGVKNFHSVGERAPEILKAAIEDIQDLVVRMSSSVSRSCSYNTIQEEAVR
jgi:hypothetical protein